ncbi:MAG TPA: BrnT family toxin [Candidatus Paceibacterota bacterium]|nr:BrnT family toxin [Candidatus Paceibacterota bacterium]
MPLRFDWDPTKATQNLAKHGVTFAEAEGVFADPLALELPDPEHSEREQRFLAIGRSYRERLVVVVFTEEVADVVRIISARLATRAETKSYEEQR